MTELELYQFIQENNVEWHEESNRGEKDILIFLYSFELGDFCKLLGQSILDDDGITIVLKFNYVCIWMQEICDHFGIEMSNVFKK